MIPFDAAYRSMRYYKCDLQMQTPADPLHWRGQGMGPAEAERRAAADAYIRRCYEAGLEVIAITDHNFASKDFLPCLREAIDRLAGEFGYEIVLFPGFEFTADVGKGVHVLAIFEQDMPIETIDHVLTQCGVPMPRLDASGRPRKSTQRLPEILEVVQRKGPGGLMPGIVILPHAQSDSGIFDTDRIADWLQAEEFLNEDLYCLEVPKPPGSMSTGWQRLLGAGPDCDPALRRKRPVACIMSSDAKALRPEEGASNYVGFRHTWIKMSRPSIEALRQAFLDHESRIRFGDQRPEEAFDYPKIRSLCVKGAAFLADQEIAFSPNLTALIGGRGTGKSTLIEYLRIVTGQEGSIRGDDPKRNFQRLKQTIGGSTEPQVVIEKEGQLFRVASRAGAPPALTEGEPVPDLARFFPARVLSQREIYAIAEDREARRRLVDDVARRELDEIGRREEDLVREIEGLNRQIASLRDLREREKVLETERRDFEVRLARLRALEAPLAHWKGRMAEERFFAALEAEAAGVARSLRDALGEVGFTITALGSELGQAPSHDLTAEVAGRADSVLEQLKQRVGEAVETFEREVRDLLAAEAVTTWRERVEAERVEFERLRRELAEQGTDPDLYLSYQRDLRERDVQFGELRRKIEAIEALRERRDGREEAGSRRPGLIDELHLVWQRGDLEGRLSVGQRCTAVLALILARDDVPVVIDQPEEDLDNEFIFVELVPLLRKIKEKREVIVATHNANIPVNGDAELLIALEVRGERGRPEELAGKPAVGGLDRHAVKRAVEDIMEGSEEAFRRRFDKYGF